jgi:citrate lyase subunit beta/citryl-CoA lyase
MSMPEAAWRSLLYVPANARRFVEGAARRGADAVILDLEDSIPATEKAAAREALAGAIATIAAAGGPDILVRVNHAPRLLVRDLEAAIAAGVAGIVLPKVAGASDVTLAAGIIAELEEERELEPGRVGIVAVIECPAGLMRAFEIASAHPRLVGLSLGDEDFASALEVEPSVEVLLVPKQQIVHAAKAAGIAPLGFIGTLADYRDLDGLRSNLEHARRLGYRGAPCIHPAQVPVINAAFSPSAQEIAQARSVIAAFEARAEAGGGTAALDGRMIDAPVVARARRLLARARPTATGAEPPSGGA